MSDSKPFYQSKTFWLQILGLIAIMFPQSRAFIEANLSASAGIWAVLNLLIRAVTKDRISLS